MNIDFSKVVSPDDIAKQKSVENKKLVADKRYEVETSGVEIDGVLFNTSRDSQSLITGAALSALIDSDYICRWKTESGYVNLDSETVLHVSKTIRAFVQACFDREYEIVEAIDSGKYTEVMLTEGWPNAVVNNA